MSDNDSIVSARIRRAKVRRASSNIRYNYDVEVLGSEDEEEEFAANGSSSRKHTYSDSSEEEAYYEKKYKNKSYNSDSEGNEADSMTAKTYTASIGAGSRSLSSLSSSPSSSQNLTKKRRKINESNSEPFMAPSVDEVLKLLRKDRASLMKRLLNDRSSSGRSRSDSLGEIGEIMKGITEVKDLDTTEVSDRIERLAVDTVLQILQKRGV